MKTLLLSLFLAFSTLCTAQIEYRLTNEMGGTLASMTYGHINGSTDMYVKTPDGYTFSMNKGHVSSMLASMLQVSHLTRNQYVLVTYSGNRLKICYHAFGNKFTIYNLVSRKLVFKTTEYWKLIGFLEKYNYQKIR